MIVGVLWQCDKTLSVIFDICHQVSSLACCSPVRMERATRVLLELLGQQIQLRNVYTHHPAMLYWAFSSPWIHPSIQKGVVCHMPPVIIFTDFSSVWIDNSFIFLLWSSVCEMPHDAAALGAIQIRAGLQIVRIVQLIGSHFSVLSPWCGMSLILPCRHTETCRLHYFVMNLNFPWEAYNFVHNT